MSKLDEAKLALTSKKEKPVKERISLKKIPGVGWEISAYIVRIISVVVPACIIMYLQNSWVKNSLGLMATATIIAVILILKEPIKKASGFAPGIIIFSIMTLIAMLFNTVVEILFVVGISGLVGSGIAIPLHLKYISYKENEKSPELQAIEALVDKLK